MKEDCASWSLHCHIQTAQSAVPWIPGMLQTNWRTLFLLRGSQLAHLTDQHRKLKIHSNSLRACCFATIQGPLGVQATLHITFSCMWGCWALPRARTRGQGQVWEGCHGAGVGWGCPTLASVVLLRASAAQHPVLICLTQGHLRRWLILRKSIFQKVIAESNAWFLNSEHSWAYVWITQFLLKAEGNLPTP